MCKVYNQIGSLTNIKSHLSANNIDDFTSIKELINFRDNYAIARSRITSDHELIIEKEKQELNIEIETLTHTIEEKRTEVEQQLLSEIEQLKLKLTDLRSANSNLFKTILDKFKKIHLKQKIRTSEKNLNANIKQSIEYLTVNHNKKYERHQYITSYFNDAVMKICQPQLRELDKKKRVVDQINNSIYGALGEQKVVKELERLSNDHVLINDFICNFQPAIYNTQENYYIKSVQIDHILIAPSGVYLIETKNWSEESITNTNLFSSVQQIKRANFALYKILNGNNSYINIKHHWGDKKIPIKNLIVFINHRPNEEFKHIKLLTLSELYKYVNYFDPLFSFEETSKIAKYLLNL